MLIAIKSRKVRSFIFSNVFVYLPYVIICRESFVVSLLDMRLSASCNLFFDYLYDNFFTQVKQNSMNDDFSLLG